MTIKTQLSAGCLILCVGLIGCGPAATPPAESNGGSDHGQISSDPGPVPEGQSEPEPAPAPSSDSGLIELPSPEAGTSAGDGGPSFPAPPQ
ncbi:MAG: hypothetical protein KDA78_17815 [Planctomycetaceae bacterium]|nr:hypothetical protein [Planctomycetaceae bacterium]